MKKYESPSQSPDQQIAKFKQDVTNKLDELTKHLSNNSTLAHFKLFLRVDQKHPTIALIDFIKEKLDKFFLKKKLPEDYISIYWFLTYIFSSANQLDDKNESALASYLREDLIKTFLEFIDQEQFGYNLDEERNRLRFMNVSHSSRNKFHEHIESILIAYDENKLKNFTSKRSGVKLTSPYVQYHFIPMLREINITRTLKKYYDNKISYKKAKQAYKNENSEDAKKINDLKNKKEELERMNPHLAWIEHLIKSEFANSEAGKIDCIMNGARKYREWIRQGSPLVIGNRKDLSQEQTISVPLSLNVSNENQIEESKKDLIKPQLQLEVLTEEEEKRIATFLEEKLLPSAPSLVLEEPVADKISEQNRIEALTEEEEKRIATFLEEKLLPSAPSFVLEEPVADTTAQLLSAFQISEQNRIVKSASSVDEKLQDLEKEKAKEVIEETGEIILYKPQVSEVNLDQLIFPEIPEGEPQAKIDGETEHQESRNKKLQLTA